MMGYGHSSAAVSLGRYTYFDYKQWEDEFRYELIEGEAVALAAPSVWHQTVVLKISARFNDFFEGKPCIPFVSPFDVRLFPQNNEDDKTVVQPDVLVVCDKSKLSDGKACRGAPDLVVEVVSPSSKIIDLMVKRELYRSAGVKEYWVVGEDKVMRWDWSGRRGDREVKDEIVTLEGKLKIRSSLFETLEVSL